MFDDGRRKKIIIVSAVIGVIIIVILLCVGLKEGVLKGEVTEPTVDGNPSYHTDGSVNSNQDSNIGSDKKPLSPNETEGSGGTVIPTKSYSGDIAKYESNGISGVLDVTDSKGGIKQVEVKTNTMFFDVSENKAIMPSKMPSSGKVRVYTYSDLEESKMDVDMVEVIMLSPKEGVDYTPIENLEKEGDIIKFTNSKLGKVFELKDNIYSALDGRVYTYDDLDDGDRVIYYSSNIDDEKVKIDKAYVYPKLN